MVDKDNIIARHLAGTLPQLFVERVRQHRSDDIGKTFRLSLLALHNAGTINLLETARTIGQSNISQTDFFIFQSVFVDLIPELDAEVPEMLAAVKALVAHAGDDLAAGMPNDAYRSWAEVGDRALATLGAIDTKDADDAAYAFLGLQALAKSELDTALDRAIALLDGGPSPARSAAAKAIGTLPLATSDARTRAADALKAAHTSGCNDNLRGHILTAICQIARTAPEMEQSALEIIAVATPDAGEQAIHQVSLELMFHAKDLPPAIAAALTAIAQKVPIANLKTLNQIDLAAGALIRAGRVDEGLALITPLISAHHTLTSLELLDSASHALLQLGGDRLAGVIASWLLALDANLGLAALSLVGDHHGSPLVLDFDASNLELSDGEAVLLAHRAIGFLFVRPITAASLVLALIRLADPKPRQAMADLLFDPLLMNYSGELADWLKSRVKDESELTQSAIADLLARLETYLEGLRKVGRVKELSPSERERLIETHRQHESMQQAHKEAEKRSILMSIVSRSVLLYGNRSIRQC